MTTLGSVPSCSKLLCQNRNRLFPGRALSWGDLSVCECVLTWQKSSHVKYSAWQLGNCVHRGLVTDRRSNKCPLQNDAVGAGVSSGRFVSTSLLFFCSSGVEMLLLMWVREAGDVRWKAKVIKSITGPGMDWCLHGTFYLYSLRRAKLKEDLAACSFIGAKCSSDLPGL